MKKTVMPKQAAPVERLNIATAGAAGGEKGVVPLIVPLIMINFPAPPFAGDDAE